MSLHAHVMVNYVFALSKRTDKSEQTRADMRMWWFSHRSLPFGEKHMYMYIDKTYIHTHMHEKSQTATSSIFTKAHNSKAICFHKKIKCTFA